MSQPHQDMRQSSTTLKPLQEDQLLHTLIPSPAMEDQAHRLNHLKLDGQMESQLHTLVKPPHTEDMKP